MINSIQLYINGNEIFFSDPPEILFTYQDTDLTNPTVVKNSYTKSITVEGTKENNKVFGEIFKLDRIQNEDNYNPSQRVPFELFRNGEIIEQGYVKLNTINRSGRKIEYDITLYGGLGEVFYNLSYDKDGNKLKLSDVCIGQVWNNSMTINKDTVLEAWDNLKYDYPDYQDIITGNIPDGYIDKHHTINFVPAYNGLPDGLDADKVLINTNSTSSIKMRRLSGSTWNTVYGFPTSGSSTAYTPFYGYALAELKDEITEWDVRDLRSWCQRPAISVRSVFEGANTYLLNNCDWWQFKYDESFFNKDNPYWEKAWVTLPKFSDLEVESTSEFGSFTLGTPICDGYVADFPVDLGAQYSSINKITVGIQPSIYANFSKSTQPTNIYTSCIPYNTNNLGYSIFGGFVVEIIAKKGDDIVAASEPVFCTSAIDGKVRNLDKMAFKSAGGYDTSMTVVGNYTRDTSKPNKGEKVCYKWNKMVTASLSTNVSEATFYVRITQVGQKDKVMFWAVSYYENSSKGWLWSNQKNPNKQEVCLHTKTWDSGKNADPGPINGAAIEPFDSIYSKAYYTTTTDIKSGAKVPYKTIIDSLGCTPMEFILSYCKLFNIHIERNDLERNIYLTKRENYFDGKVIDIDDCIDRGKNIKITPLAFDYKWYDFKYSDGEVSEFSENYKKKYTYQYGIQKVNSGFNFNADSKDLLTGNTFNAGLQALEKSRYNIDIKTGGGFSSMLPSFFMDGSFTYKLFDSSISDDEITLSYPIGTTDYKLNSSGPNYDCFDKLQLHKSNNEAIDGAGILCFFDGYNTCVDSGGYNINYCVSDDIETMITLNDGLCWYYTTVNTSNATLTNKLPHFSRYIMDGDEIVKTWDFGKTKELYVPYYRFGMNSTLYEQYWNELIADEYDINTRVVECYVRWKTPINGKILKHFFWFDNSLWILSKVNDYNVSSYGTTKCKFLKVNDPNVYTNTYDKPVIPQSLSVSPSMLIVPNTGGEYTISINFTNRNGETVFVDHNESYDYLSWSNISWDKDEGTMILTVSENDTATVRNMDYLKFETMGDNYLTAHLSVIQEASSTSNIILSKSSGTIPQGGGYNVVYVICDGAWTIASDMSFISFSLNQDDAVKVSTLSGRGNSYVRVWFSENGMISTRNATITGTSGDYTSTVSISQYGIDNNAVYLEFDEDNYWLYIRSTYNVIEDIPVFIYYTDDDVFGEEFIIKKGTNSVKTNLSLQDFDENYGNFTLNSVVINGDISGYLSKVSPRAQWLYLKKASSSSFIEAMDDIGNTSYNNITWGLPRRTYLQAVAQEKPFYDIGDFSIDEDISIDDSLTTEERYEPAQP